MSMLTRWAIVATLVGITATVTLGGPPPPRSPVVGHLEAPNDPPAVLPFERKLEGKRRALPVQVWSRNGYQSVQVNVTYVDGQPYNIVGDAANEPSIAVDPTNPNRLVIGWRQFDTVASNFRQAGWSYSHDGGRAWTFPGVLEPGVFRSDPVLDVDAGGYFYFYSLRDDYTCQLFKSYNSGVSWIGPIDAYGGDKAWIAIDRTGGIGHGNFYAAWDYAGCCGNDWFTRSTNGGATFDTPIPIPEQPMWGTAAVGPDGEVYIAGRRRYTSTEFIVAKSSTIKDPNAPLAFDFAIEVDLGGRLLYSIGSGPNPGGLLGQVWVAVDHSTGPTRSNVYVLSSVQPDGVADPLDVHFIRSTDGGLTWSDPVRVNDDPVGYGAWQWFGTMSVAPNGRIDVVFNDTRNSGYDNISELFYTFSTDAGLTWSANVAVSPTFNSHLGWPQQNKLGDYYDMVSDNVGIDVAYAATFNGEQDIYYLRVGSRDCNQNDIPDACDIDCGPSGGDCDLPGCGLSEDCNCNGTPDECECLWDLDGNGVVDPFDSNFVIGRFGCPVGTGYPGCDEADINCDGTVDPFDSNAVEAHFGICP